MLIGAAVNGPDLHAVVPENYEDATHLVIVETDDDSVAAVYESGDADGVYFADMLYRHDCEAVVCGRMQRPGFERVADRSITRFYGAGLSVMDAVHLGLDNALPNITDYEGGPGCDSREHVHEEGYCDGSCGALPEDG